MGVLFLPWMLNIEVVIWDLGNVLIGSDMDRIVENFSQITGLTNGVVDELLLGGDITMRTDTPFYNFSTGKITPNEFYNELKKILRANFSYQECMEAWENNFYPMGGMIDLYQQVAERFVERIGILSDCDPVHIDFIERNFPDVRKCIYDAAIRVYSFREGLKKPNPEIYGRIMLKMEDAVGKTIRPNGFLFIDDKEANVEATLECGWHGIVFKNRGKLEGDLKEMGVL